MVCPKCGGIDVTVSYCKGHTPGKVVMGQPTCRIEGEHLHRRCEACGYGWDEPTKDAGRRVVLG